jgi:hypothetical protein
MGGGENLCSLGPAYISYPSIKYEILQLVKKVWIEVSPLLRLLQIRDELAMGTTIVRSEHPANGGGHFTQTREGPEQAILPVVVYVTKVLILHKLASHFVVKGIIAVRRTGARTRRQQLAC